MNFIKVTTTNKQEMYLNADFIESVVTATAINGPTRLRFVGLVVEVSNTIEDVMGQIEKARGAKQLLGEKPWYKKVLRLT